MTSFDPYIEKWHLKVEGDCIETQSSSLLPVSYRKKQAVLKIAKSREERIGGSLMVWWKGKGAAPIFKFEDSALLMERAINKNSLSDLAIQGHDDVASRIICSVVKTLHSHSPKNHPLNLLSLEPWFWALKRADKSQGGLFSKSYAIAKDLLSSQQEIVVLHGDIHHANILDFGSKGWLAIDPKHIMGDRAYDYANIFCNPTKAVALEPNRLMKQVEIVSKEAQLDPKRLLKWIAAYAGLSASWFIEDGENPDLATKIAHLSLAEL